MRRRRRRHHCFRVVLLLFVEFEWNQTALLHKHNILHANAPSYLPNLLRLLSPHPGGGPTNGGRHSGQLRTECGHTNEYMIYNARRNILSAWFDNDICSNRI